MFEVWVIPNLLAKTVHYDPRMGMESVVTMVTGDCYPI